MRAITENQSEFLTPFRHLAMGVPADFRLACLWSALGLTLTGLFFAPGFGGEIGVLALSA